MSNLTDEQIYGRELSQEDDSAAVAEHFYPYEKTPCMCWVDGDCQSFICSGKCIFKMNNDE